MQALNHTKSSAVRYVQIWKNTGVLPAVVLPFLFLFFAFTFRQSEPSHADLSTVVYLNLGQGGRGAHIRSTC